jgi:hypothetical protein
LQHAHLQSGGPSDALLSSNNANMGKQDIVLIVRPLHGHFYALFHIDKRKFEMIGRAACEFLELLNLSPDYNIRVDTFKDAP